MKDLDWASTQVHKVWLKAYKVIQVAGIDLENGDIAYIATSDLALAEPEPIKAHYAYRWQIEVFHRGIKQCCGIEHCYSQVEQSQPNHILCAFLAFLKLEIKRIKEGISWYEQKRRISRVAIAAYLSNA